MLGVEWHFGVFYNSNIPLRIVLRDMEALVYHSGWIFTVVVCYHVCRAHDLSIQLILSARRHHLIPLTNSKIMH